MQKSRKQYRKKSPKRENEICSRCLTSHKKDTFRNIGSPRFPILLCPTCSDFLDEWLNPNAWRTIRKPLMSHEI